MIRRILKSAKLIRASDNLEFLTTNSIYLNKSLLYYQTTINNVEYKKILEKNTFKRKLKIYSSSSGGSILSQHSYYSADHSSSYTKLGSIELARQFVNSLTLEERNVIKEQIIENEKQAAATETTNKIIEKPTWRQISVVCLQCGIPFIGFGFVDNFLMIIAGDFIESSIGMMVPISTMAAAGLGNAVSDVAGIGIAHHIEAFSLKLVKAPQLTSEQWELPIVTRWMAFSKSICIFVGCVIGMAPLLFHSDEKKDKKESSKDDNAEKKKE